MNSKGFLSLMVAVAAIVLVALASLTFQSNISTQQAFSTQETALEAKNAWTNVRYLLDKTASKAMHDEVIANGCAIPDGFGLTNSFNALITSINSEVSTIITCNFSSLSQVQNSIPFSFELECSKSVAGSSVSFKSLVELQKEVSMDNSDGCKVNVLDLQSGEFDIEEFALATT